MFPGESGTSPDSYNPSSSSSSSASTPTIPADNVGLYMHPYYHPHPHPQQHVSYYDYSRDMAACSSEATMNSSTTNHSIQAAISAGYLTRDQQAQLLFMQDLHNAPHALAQIQGLSMNYTQAQFYNEQILRSLTGSHCRGIEPSTSVYESQGLLNSVQAQQSSFTASHEVLQNRTLGSSDQETPTRYEETCTPRPRWSPTHEQIEILEALFNSGTRTPSRDMITEIAAELRKYGTIGEANVFYWFQNRKARAKKKQLKPASCNPASSSCP